MVTPYQVSVARHLMTLAGLDADRIGPQHLTASPHPAKMGTSVAEWLAAMPAEPYAELVRHLEDHSEEINFQFSHAQRMVGILVTLLHSKDDRPLHVNGLRPYDEVYGPMLRAIANDYAARSMALVIDRSSDYQHDAPLPVLLLLRVAGAVDMAMEVHGLPRAYNEEMSFIQATSEAIRATLVWLCLHAADTSNAPLRTAADTPTDLLGRTIEELGR